MRGALKVLVLTNMYPSAHGPTDGIFVQRQVEGLRQAQAGIEVRVCHVDTIRAKRRYLTGWLRAARALAAFRPDVVHVHYGLSLAFFPPPLSLFWPSVVTLHGSDVTIGWQRRFTRLMLPMRATLVAVSGALSTRLLGPGRAPARVIACGVRAADFAGADPAPARAHLGLAQGQTLVLFGANPNRPVKCHALFEQAAARLAARQPGYRFASLAEVPPAMVPSLIAAAAVLVLTSEREGSPVVTKEALCAGTRVVSVEVGDVADQLAGFAGAAVVRERSGEAIAQAIARVLAGPAPDKAVAAARFDIAREVGQLIDVYKHIAGD